MFLLPYKFGFAIRKPNFPKKAAVLNLADPTFPKKLDKEGGLLLHILCFGDSNTYGYDPRACSEGRYAASHRWPELLARQSGWEVRNRGENGREIPHREWELQQFSRLLASCPALDRLLILLGTNDLLQGNSAAAVACRMEAFLEQIPLERGKLLLIAPPPLQKGAWVQEDSLLQESRCLPAAYQALCQRLSIPFADAGGWGIGLCFDGVHFSEAGQRRFAERLLPLLG